MRFLGPAGARNDMNATKGCDSSALTRASE
jgi:hypothetical protein